jgi:hypothetical protein
VYSHGRIQINVSCEQPFSRAASCQARDSPWQRRQRHECGNLRQVELKNRTAKNLAFLLGLGRKG